MQQNGSSVKAIAYILFGAFMVSFTSVFVELAHVGPTVSAFYRMFFGGIILLIVVVMRRRQFWFGFKSLAIPFLCAFLFSFDLFFWHRSIIYVGPGLATILGNMQVFIVALLAVLFLKERLSRRIIIAIPIAVAGLFLIIQTGWGEHQGEVKLGVIFGLLTAFSYALYILFLRYSRSAGRQSSYSAFANMAWISLLAALLLGITAWIEPGSSFAIPDTQSWAALIGVAVAGQVLGWVCISKGLPGVSASIAGLALLIQPALAFMWDILFFGRPTTAREYIGAAMVLAAIYAGTTGRKK